MYRRYKQRHELHQLMSAHSRNLLLPSLHGSDTIHLLCGVPIPISNPTSKERAQHTSQLLNNSLSNRLLSSRHNTHEAILHSSAPLVLLLTLLGLTNFPSARYGLKCSASISVFAIALFFLFSQTTNQQLDQLTSRNSKQKSYNREPRKRRRSVRDTLP
jgi:hypothetical protein